MKSATTTTGESSRDDAKYRGVRKRKWGKWVSEIRLPNSRERIWLGSYDSPEKAARAFDAALFCLRGNTANFNFPDQPPNIPGGTELHPSQIQAVAARFANSYCQLPAPESSSSSSHPNDHVSNFMEMDVVPPSSSQYLMMEDNNNNINNNINIPDFGIFPGFDDYFNNNFMPMEPAEGDQYYGEDVVNYDQGVYSQDPCYLWSF
ncbi:hypothetical protein SSX86_004092 [Deinandra increscens subsp. villosa]|uniref:AP2/ERF domain-containing protein n=1 Tax=Deinandra increscens subsp. villosa TaxID=3103831 RepID=A0AAP0H5M4_9ASTR